MEIIVDKNYYTMYGNSTYKGFYDNLTNKLNIDICNADTLREFLWQNRSLDIHFIFIGFDLNKIIEGKTSDDIKWKEIISAVNSFVITYPNNVLTFDNCIGGFVNEIVIDRENYKSYGYYSFKGFYTDIYTKLDGKNIVDFANIENCNCNADLLNEFLWYNHTENIRFIFINFDLEEIKTKKTYDNYEWGLIIDVVNRFVKEFPNNTLEFKSKN